MTRYPADELLTFATSLFERAGFDTDKSEAVATHLLEGDLLGYSTHGLALAAPYLDEAANGNMRISGTPEVISDRPAALVLEGKSLPGPWLVRNAIATAIERATDCGMAAVSITDSHHIACLAAYLGQATDKGMIVLVASSNPGSSSVAPYGGKAPLFTPNPLAVGIPTTGNPIHIDISSSVTASGKVDLARASGKKLPGQWILDSHGVPTDDPSALYSNGSILPLGGMEAGYKGFGMAIMVEALTQGLSGFGRADSPSGWRASVFVNIIDPNHFAGEEQFRRQTGYFAETCRSNPPIDPDRPVRMPGDKSLAEKERQLTNGVDLHASIISDLSNWSKKFGLDMPRPMPD